VEAFVSDFDTRSDALHAEWSAVLSGYDEDGNRLVSSTATRSPPKQQAVGAKEREEERLARERLFIPHTASEARHQQEAEATIAAHAADGDNSMEAKLYRRCQEGGIDVTMKQVCKVLKANEGHGGRAMTQIRKEQKQRDRQAARGADSPVAAHPWAAPEAFQATVCLQQAQMKEATPPRLTALAEAEEKYLQADAKLQQGIDILQSRLSPENNPDSHAKEDRGLRDETHRVEAYLFQSEMDKLRGE